MADRDPLTEEEREALRDRLAQGDQSMLLDASEDCPITITAHPEWGTVDIGEDQKWSDGETREQPYRLDVDEARRTARDLLMLADHAEFGPGEWRNGEWEREDRGKL